MVDGAVRVDGTHEPMELLKLYVILNTDYKRLEEEKWQRRIARMAKIGLNHPLVVSPHAITRQNDKGWIDTIQIAKSQSYLCNVFFTHRSGEFMRIFR